MAFDDSSLATCTVPSCVGILDSAELAAATPPALIGAAATVTAATGVTAAGPTITASVVAAGFAVVLVKGSGLKIIQRNNLSIGPHNFKFGHFLLVTYKVNGSSTLIHQMLEGRS